MMDINKIYNDIVGKLGVSGYNDIILELKESIGRASTGGEAVALSASYLLKLKNEKPLVYKLIQKEVDDYLKYSKANN